MRGSSTRQEYFYFRLVRRHVNVENQRIGGRFLLMLTMQCEEVFCTGLRVALRACIYLHPNRKNQDANSWKSGTLKAQALSLQQH